MLSVKHRKLDFIIIGAGKAGTTLLVEMFRKMPEFSMPANDEVHYFDTFESGRVEDLEQEVGTVDWSKLVGIKDPAYLYGRKVAPRIFEYNPNVKLVAILRNPVDRCLSHYLHYVRHGQVPPLHPNVGIPYALNHQEASTRYPDIFNAGKYFTNLQWYYNLFGPQQILLVEFTRFIHDQETRKILDFLRVTDENPPRTWPVNEGKHSWSGCLIDHVRSRLTNQYDQRMNILRAVDGDASSLQALEQLGALSEGQEEILMSQDVRRALVNLYQDEVLNLRNSGKFDPSDWTEFFS